VTYQDGVLQVFGAEHADDVGNVKVEVHLGPS
jgi:hypothetical protein